MQDESPSHPAACAWAEIHEPFGIHTYVALTLSFIGALVPLSLAIPWRGRTIDKWRLYLGLSICNQENGLQVIVPCTLMQVSQWNGCISHLLAGCKLCQGCVEQCDRELLFRFYLMVSIVSTISSMRAFKVPIILSHRRFQKECSIGCGKRAMWCSHNKM